MGKRRSRQTKLEMTVARIHQRFGPRSLVKGRPQVAFDAPAVFPHISTGFPKLDDALSIGGLPKGKITEIAGLPTSGKTTLALKFLTQAQAGGGQVGYIDQARYFDPDYAHRCGLDLSRLLVGTPYGLQEALSMTEALARSSGLSALVFDAMDFLWADPYAASQLAATLGRLSVPLARSGMAFLLLHTAPSDDSAPHSALAHCVTVQLRVVRERWLRQHDDVRGYEARVEVIKNRLGPSGRTVTIAIEFNGTVRGNGL
jgi:recombination protein RecA